MSGEWKTRNGLLASLPCCLVALLPVQASAEPSGGSVRLWPEAVVIGDQIRLGDVAQLDGFGADLESTLKGLVVNSAPEPGGSRIVGLEAVRDTLSGAGVNRAGVIVKGAAECAVRRPAEAVGAADESAPASHARSNEPPAGQRTLRDAVIQYFNQQMAAYGGRAEVDFGRTSAQMLDLVEPQFHFRIQRNAGPGFGLIHLEAAILRGTEQVQRIPLVVNVALVRDVVVARTAINRDAAIRPEDVHVVPWQFARADRAGLAHPGEAVGLKARRFIAAGEMLTPQDLERVPLVKRGQIVEVVSRIGGVTVKTAAKVSEDGEYGDLVTLHLQGQRKSQIVARVLGPRRVLVDDRGAPQNAEVQLAGGER